MKFLRRTAAVAVLGLAALGVAHAEGDATAGKGKAAVCAGCHGADGNSAVPNFPKLAGQGEKYLIKQMKDIKSGARTVPEMTGILNSLSEQDMADVAAYFSSQTKTLGGTKPELLEAGKALYRGGNMETGVTACTACHGNAGQGMDQAGFPALSGQHAGYIATQLKAFRAAGRNDETGKRRENDGETAMMRSIAAKLSDSEIEAVSSYITGLH